MSPALPCFRWMLAALLCWIALPAGATPCPFCTQDGRTLANELQDAHFVVYGRLGQARTVQNADGTETSTTELQVLDLLKPHETVRGKKMIVLPRYMPKLDEKQPDQWLFFCYSFEGRIDPYLGFAVRDQQFVNYVKGVLGPKQENRVARTKFFFDHLDSENDEITADAYREFAYASYDDVRNMVAAHRDDVRKKMLGWLNEHGRHQQRLGLYGMMLGLSGKPEDAAVLRDILSNPDVVIGLDGLLAGYVLLNRTEGWAFLVETLQKRQKNNYNPRLSAFRTVKFFLKDHKGIIPEKDIWDAFKVVVEDPDLADLAMQELRHAKHWSHVDQILALDQKDTHQTFSIQKAILQYMLRCPDEKAKQYVAKVKLTSPQRVKNAEEDLLYDSPPP
jgi:hypothetical protein